MTRFIYVVILISLTGCSNVGNINKLVTLRDFGNEQGANDRWVDQKEEIFKELVQDYNSGTINQYIDKASILRQYGEPLFVKKLINEEEKDEMWLYRRPVNFFDSDKVYLYFNTQGQVVSHHYERFVE